MSISENWILTQNDSFLQNHQTSLFLKTSSTQLRPDRETKIHQELVNDQNGNERKIVSQPEIVLKMKALTMLPWSQ